MELLYDLPETRAKPDQIPINRGYATHWAFACQAWLWLLFCLALSVAPFSAQNLAILMVSILGIDGAEGRLGIALWDSGLGFPEDIEHALSSTYVAIENGTARTDFERLAP